MIGHLQPGSPKAVSHTWITAAPTRMSTILRFSKSGAKTGVNSHLKMRIRPEFIFKLSVSFITVRM
ncbi:MAG: hypothetical protein JRI94_10275 [Deltaproteobacteria bacterium]|nr:hypothetical protein [Deltaproteobacteria bacterium]